MFLGLTSDKVMALLIIGFIGGLLSGFIGSGGAFVLTPAMMSLGVPGAVAVASNMCHKFPKAMVGAYKRFKYGQVDLKLGLIMAVSAIVGVQVGVYVQKIILNQWGNAGSNLYVSLVFVAVLVIVGSFVFYDAWKLSKGGQEAKVSRLALAVQKINIPPMIYFKTVGVRISVWVTLPLGFATGMLAATIAVGGFIGVPAMIYVMGASAIVGTATELVIAFVMGFWGSVQWAMSGLVDIRLTLLILAASLIGVQLGALGTTYVKDYVVKVVMGAVMLIVAVSRGAKVPIYFSDLGIMSVSSGATLILDKISFWALVAALGTAGIIIAWSMISGMIKVRSESREIAPSREAIVSHV
ncbi:MAG: sulfite exporter TauE/SafE family protein [Pseudomonadota bacterium]